MCKTIDRLEELSKIRSYINALKSELRKDPLGDRRHIDLVCTAENYILQEILKEVKLYCENKENK